MNDLHEVIDLLRSQTIDGKLRWNFLDDSLFATKQGDSTIEVAREKHFGFRVKLRNKNGIALSDNFCPQADQQAKVLSDLFERARRDALGVDEAISDVKSRLLQL